MSKQYQDELQSDINQKADLVVNELPLFCKRYFDHMRTIDRSPRTRLQYAYDLKRFFSFIQLQAGFSNTNIYKCSNISDVLDKLTYDDIQEYLDTLNYSEVEDYKGATKQKVNSSSFKARNISTLRSFYKFYYKHGLLEKDMANLMEMPKIKNKEKFALSGEQVSRLFDAVEQYGQGHKERDKAMLSLLFWTGIRVSELVGIDITDIDFKAQNIVITRKGGDQDLVFYSKEVEEPLLIYLEERKKVVPKDKSNALFLSNMKKRISVRMIQELIGKYAGLAGLSNMNVTPHTARRTFGTNLYEIEHDIDMVADTLNHKSIQTTRRYIKSKEDNKKRAQALSSKLYK